MSAAGPLACALAIIGQRGLLRCLRRLDGLATKNPANEPGNLLKSNEVMASFGLGPGFVFPFLASARHAGLGSGYPSQPPGRPQGYTETKVRLAN